MSQHPQRAQEENVRARKIECQLKKLMEKDGYLSVQTPCEKEINEKVLTQSQGTHSLKEKGNIILPLQRSL